MALLSTIGVMIIGVLLGSIAGYFRGWIDTTISRITEVTMAFPLLLFIIALAATIGPQLNAITFHGVLPKGVFTLVLIFTIFGWFYPARIMRAQVLSIREKEYIEAARMIGASDMRIIRSHVLPHLIAPMIVYSTLIVASYVLFEAGLSFLGLGIKLPTASWGNLLSDGSAVLHDQALADALAGPRGAADDPRLQPSRRRSPGRVRPAFLAALTRAQEATNQLLTLPS